MSYRSAILKYAISAGFFLTSGLAVAEIPAVPTLFPINQECTPGQLLYREVGMGRITNIVYHNGHFYTNNVGGANTTAREFKFADINDPGSFEQVFTPNLQSMSDAQSHGHTKVGDYVAGYSRVGYPRKDVGDNEVSFNPPPGWISSQQQPRAAGSRSHRLYYPWSVPFNWLQYGPSSGTARLYRAEKLLAEWQPGIVGNSILLGNLLFIASDASMQGVSVFDISPVFDSPAQAPRLVNHLSDAVGGYLGAIWENYLLLVGGAKSNLLYVIDISDPGAMYVKKTFNLAGKQAFNTGGGVPYIQTQDNYVFTRGHKIDMELLEIVRQFDEVGTERPDESVAGPLNISQYNLPLGNLMVSGGNAVSGRDGIGIWCHQNAPDRRGPYVGYHIPRADQTNFPLGAPISLVIAEELESFTIVSGESIIVKPAGGQAIDGWTSFSHDGVLTFTPKQYLLPDTLYEVILPAEGIRDISGNGIDAYSFTFSTGNSVGGGSNAAPVIHEITSSVNPSVPGESVLVTANATDADFDDVEYRFDFGDGTPATSWSTSSSAIHTFNQAGNYTVKVQVKDIKPEGNSSSVSDTFVQTVASPLPVGSLPVSSSMLALDNLNRVVWAVNPDNDSVSRMDADAYTLLDEINLRTVTAIDKPLKPTSIAVDQRGQAWIVARDANVIVILDSQGNLQRVINTGYGSRPQAVLISQDGSQAFVSVTGRGENDAGNGQLLRYSTDSFAETGRLELGKHPRAMALSGNGNRLFVAAFLSDLNYGTIWEINSAQMSLTTEIKLQRDRGAAGLDAGTNDGPGVPNYIADLVISPDDQWLWYTAIKADTNRGLFFAQQTNLNLPFSPDSTVRSMLGRIDLGLNPPREPEFGNAVPLVSRVDVDNSDSPSSLAFSPLGNYVFVTLQGNDTLMAFNDLDIRQGGGEVNSMWRAATGSAPQASLMDASSKRLWIKNLMSRDLSVIDLNPFISNGSTPVDTATISTVQLERLAPDVLEGKKRFYFAGNDPAGVNNMSSEGYISCASCHIDGSHDGRIWDFTQRGEGFRNTTDLRGRRGTGHGNVHWSANFDEIQDFVLDIVNHFGGQGFLSAEEQLNESLGAPHSQLHLELDQLSAYVTSLDQDSIPQSPYRSSNGEMTAAAQAGEIVFNQNGCDNCHKPSNDFNDSELGTSPLLHDVGTIRTSSGQRLGSPLTGLDTPTLLGVWETQPYFHDGSAQTLEDVFSIAGGENIQAELASLSGGAIVQDANAIEMRQDSSAHGEFVVLPGNGTSMRLSAIDGGAGGLGAIELRVMERSRKHSAPLTVTVNGDTFSVQIDPSVARLEWRLVRIEGVTWLAGENNTVSIKHNGGANYIYVDEVIVSRSNDLNKALPHRQVMNLNTENANNLLAYLRQLDGSNSSENASAPDPAEKLLTNGDFEQGQVDWTNLGVNRTVLTGSSECRGASGNCLKIDGSNYRHVDHINFAVTALQAYDFSGHIKVAGLTSGNAKFLVRWFNGNTAISGYIGFGQQASNTTGFVRKNRTLTAPLNATMLQVQAIKVKTNVEAIAYFDDVMVTTQSGGRD